MSTIASVGCALPDRVLPQAVLTEAFAAHVDPAGAHRSTIERLHAAGLAEVREGEVGLLRDLQDLHVLATLVQTTWTVVSQGAQGLRDTELLEIAQTCNAETSRQLSWLNTRMKVAAPQALIVAP